MSSTYKDPNDINSRLTHVNRTLNQLLRTLKVVVNWQTNGSLVIKVNQEVDILVQQNKVHMILLCIMTTLFH